MMKDQYEGTGEPDIPTFGEVNPANKCAEEINGTERKIY
jgi:hypothetical protein